MKKVLIICLLAAAVSMAQRQRVVVLPSIADPETKFSARELDVLTEKLRGHASDVLPLDDFLLLKQDYVREKLGDEALFEACKEGTCVGDLIAMVQANFGARCDVFSVRGKLWLKFELYGTLRDEDNAGTISTFSEEVKDLKAMLAVIEKKVPDAFKKILLPKPSPAAAAPAKPAAPVVSEAKILIPEPSPAAPPPAQYAAPTASETKNDAEAYYKKGVEYFEKGDHDRAISDFTQAIRLNPNYVEAYSNRGMAYGNKGDYDKAIYDFNEAIRRNPKNANAYYNRGLTYGIKGNNDKAIADLKSALRIDPNHSGAKEALESRTAPPPVAGGAIGEALTDSKNYKTVKIGTQTWMAENLNYNASGSKCYENKQSNCNKYGRLYNWETAMNVCPSGWHLPSRSEYEALDRAVGGEDVAGEKLKAKSGWGSWFGNRRNGTDEYGFSALPGGIGYSGSSFDNVGGRGYWWSADEDINSNAYYRIMGYNNNNAYWSKIRKSTLLSVRCLQD